MLIYMSTNDTLNIPTINGLQTLTLDALNTDALNASSMDGNYFSIQTIEAGDVQVDNELELTNTGFIIVGKGSPTEVIITDDEVKFLAGITSNVQNQIDGISINTTDIINDIGDNTHDITVNRQNIDINATNINTFSTNIGINTTNIGINTTNVNYNIMDISKNKNYININTSDISSNLGLINVNTSDISSNLGNINVNTSNISSNLGLINTNTSNISSNLGLINVNTSNISSNLGLINTNTSNISSNNMSISSNLAAINVNAGRINDNFTDITTNTNDIISTNNMLNLLEVDVGLNINSINDIEYKTNRFEYHPNTFNMYGGIDASGNHRSILLHSGSNYIHLYSNIIYFGNATANTKLVLNGQTQTKAFTDTIYNKIYNPVAKLNLVSYPNWLITGMTSFTAGTTYVFTHNYEPLTDAVYAPYTVVGVGGFRVWNAGPKRLLVKYAVAFTGLSTRIVEFKTKMTHDQDINYFTTLYSGREYTGNGTNLHDVLMYNDHMVLDMVDGDRIILSNVFNMEMASSGIFNVECTVNMTEI